tara:strand:+ start:629 stop:910 length:282 start_codon:yes stop_codon:yes gene_type:complete
MVQKQELIMFYEALKKKYEAEIEESLVTLRIYMNKSVGIGEHSDLITELDKYVTKLAAAEDNLETLERHKVSICETATGTESTEGLKTHTLNT